MPFERQVTYLNLIVESVTIDEISPHICKLALSFKPPIVGTLTGYLMRPHGEPIKWRDEEKEAIQQLYGHLWRKRMCCCLGA
jgi:hypothetical protein